MNFLITNRQKSPDFLRKPQMQQQFPKNQQMQELMMQQHKQIMSNQEKMMMGPQ